MKEIKYIYAILLCCLVASCDFLEPEVDNTRESEILDEAAYFCGPLNAVYNSLPSSFDVGMDALTDNAVIRDMSGDYYTNAIGGMTPQDNILCSWSSCYGNIRLLNVFLSRMVLDESTEYQTPIRFFALDNEQAYVDNMNMFYRLKGEAYGLRAYYQYVLLKNFAGEGSDGRMLGVPVVGDKILDRNQDLKIPRETLDNCVDAIVADCDAALECRLPDLYSGTKDRVYNQTMSPHLSGAAVKAIKAKALLLAASPAYNKANDPAKWEAAAEAAAEALKAVGGMGTAWFTRDEYYFTKINNTSILQNNVIMKGKWLTGNSALEQDNYPVALYGNATVNVSQNFVDSFTDKNGYPIAESNIYNPEKPYSDRDPRLNLFVAVDGSNMAGYQIDIAGAESYSPGRKTTRSGYYLKKTLRVNQVVCGPSNATKGTPRACIIIGLPELYLMYAEAANEAWGVTADPKGYGFTAKQALNKVLVRDGKDGNKYLNEVIGADQDKFREYVRLQRRIELCFEGHYYYDLRRWYASDADWASKINVPVYGVVKEGLAYKPVLLENRKFASQWPAIPYSEEFNAGLVQNKGWK